MEKEITLSQKSEVNESINAYIDSNLSFRDSVLTTLDILIKTYDKCKQLGLKQSANNTMLQINYCKSKIKN
jgi:hypothetical protein